MLKLPSWCAVLAMGMGLSAASTAFAAEVPVHHDLSVTLDPNGHSIEVVDRVTLPAPARDQESLTLTLHRGLKIAAISVAHEKAPDVEGAGAVPRQVRVLRPGSGEWPDPFEVTVEYAGEIYHPLVSEGAEYARSFSRSPGLISEEGVVLSGASAWWPRFEELEDTLETFRLRVDLPSEWDVVSQGKRTEHSLDGDRRRVTWECAHPMDEIYLIAARFTEYSRACGTVTAQAFLRAPDPNLAAKYLETTAQYLEMYRQLIGPYPYEKFALVENFWETGFGMPSFTLLGSKIIRFPFILHSSYPHEILHNWWGNSVFVDWERGNWCEGLTAYLADHLVKEGQGRGAEYRRNSLERYRNFVRGARDFPLVEFRSRHSGATEAVGYGKSLMLWHMLRRRLGDERFGLGLRRFYREYKFERASFSDLEKVFSGAAEEDLAPFFVQWVERTGAPALALTVEGTGSEVVLQVTQTQAEEPYALRVPVAVSVAGRGSATVEVLEITQRVERFERSYDGAVERVDLDPEFDIFRRLDQEETPPTLGSLFGADHVTLVLPERSPLASGWQKFAESWAGESVSIVKETDLVDLPADRAVWFLGTENGGVRFLAPTLERFAAGIDGESLRIDGSARPKKDLSFAFTTRHPGNDQLAVGWVGADRADALPGLARKLPHYGKYSYLAFSGSEPTNVAKGQWEATASPLVVTVAPGSPRRGALPTRAPLARLAPVFDPARLMTHVEYLAADAREGRGAGTAGLDASAQHIAETFREAGLEPGGDDGYFQSFEATGPDGKPVTLRNVIGVIPGRKPEWSRQSVVVGAHYDHLGRGWPDVRQGFEGQIHNGADDNGSGVAVMLEVATRLAAELEPSRSLIFVAFSGEEMGLLGSRHYVKSMERWPARNALAMLNLDTVGRLGEQKLTVLGSATATEWIHIAMGVGFTTGIESRCVPDDPGGSDQVAFHEVGVPAVQLFTGAHEDYHRPSDDVDEIDGAGLVKVATFLRESVVYLTERDSPLTSKLQVATTPRQPPAKRGRRVSLGTIPEYGFAGPGVKITGTVSGSPAAQAGLEKGDVLLSIDGVALENMRGYATALGKYAPGDEIAVRFRRGDVEKVVRVRLVAR